MLYFGLKESRCFNFVILFSTVMLLYHLQALAPSLITSSNTFVFKYCNHTKEKKKKRVKLAFLSNTLASAYPTSHCLPTFEKQFDIGHDGCVPVLYIRQNKTNRQLTTHATLQFWIVGPSGHVCAWLGLFIQTDDSDFKYIWTPPCETHTSSDFSQGISGGPNQIL